MVLLKSICRSKSYPPFSLTLLAHFLVLTCFVLNGQEWAFLVKKLIFQYFLKTLLKYFLKFLESLIKNFSARLLKYIAFFKMVKCKNSLQDTFNVTLEWNNYLEVPVVQSLSRFPHGYIVMDWRGQKIGVDRCSLAASSPSADWRQVNTHNRRKNSSSNFFPSQMTHEGVKIYIFVRPSICLQETHQLALLLY